MAELDELRIDVLAALSDTQAADGEELVGRVCDASVRLLPVDGAEVSLIVGETGWQTVYASDTVSAGLAELQFSLGEGPCFEAHERGGPVLVPDLATASVRQWPVFAVQAREYPVSALFTFPIQLGAIRIAAMDTYRTTPGPLTAEELSVALQLAEIAMLAVSALGADSGEWLDAGGAPLQGASLRHREVHQAIGMLTVQLGVSGREALARMRGYAFGQQRSLVEVAGDIVAHRLRLDRDER